MKRVDLLVVGAGIMGLAHATLAAKAGKRVLVLERHPAAMGASVRNFGMVWPIGQPPGELLNIALRSREIWLETLIDAGLWFDRCGSVQLALDEIEAQVLGEFLEVSQTHGYRVHELPRQELRQRYPLIRAEHCQRAVFSETEVCVDPRQVISELPGFLQERYGVEFGFSEPSIAIDGLIVSTIQRQIEAERVVICPGEDFRTLYPGLLEEAGMTLCKLQMMRLEPSHAKGRLGTMVAGGLTLGHYGSYAITPSYAELKAYHAERYAPCVEAGIHVMASQHEGTQVTVGDTHEYGPVHTPFTDETWDRLVLEYLNRMIQSQDWKVASRWIGVYAKHADNPVVRLHPESGITVVGSPGGAGMTLSFGIAEQTIQQFGWL